MGYKNKTNIEYQNDYYSKNNVNRNQYYKDYYRANHEYIRVCQCLNYHNNKKERDIKKVYVIQNKFTISLEE